MGNTGLTILNIRRTHFDNHVGITIRYCLNTIPPFNTIFIFLDVAIAFHQCQNPLQIQPLFLVYTSLNRIRNGGNHIFESKSIFQEILFFS